MSLLEPANLSSWTELLKGRIAAATAVRATLLTVQPHYVYVLCQPDGTPFYVGKGVQHRCFNHEAEARNTQRLTHKLNLLRAMHRRGDLVGYCIENSYLTEEEAHARERFLIALFGRHDQRRGPLTNQTDGGEGASNPSEESRERRRQSLWGEAEDDERRAANRWFRTLCEVKSVPVKPLSRFKPERLHANRAEFAMSPRQAAALVASAVVNHVLLEPGAVIPRLMRIGGVAMAIENGVGRDILSSGMATLADPSVGAETLTLTRAGYGFTVSSISRSVLEDAGVLLPDLN
ncbi:MAG TPA: GIY-YIG nuclease family protein [Sphingomonas sp.]